MIGDEGEVIINTGICDFVSFLDIKKFLDINDHDLLDFDLDYDSFDKVSGIIIRKAF